MENSYVRPDGRILHSCTSLDDSFVTDYVREAVAAEDRVPTHNRAIATGYRAIAAAQANGGLLALSDQLQSSVKAAGEHAEATTKQVTGKIDALVKAHLARDGSISKAFDDFEKSVGGQLDPNSLPMQKLRQHLHRDRTVQDKALLDEVRGLMNLADEKSPVGRILREIHGIDNKVGQLKTQVESITTITQARRASAFTAGRQLEDFVNDILANMASLHGETFDDVRDEQSKIAGRSKKGDFVTTLDARLTRGNTARLVTEAKNRKTGSISGLLDELNQAMHARGATAAIGILTNPNAKCRAITAYEGNKVLISLPSFGAPECDYNHFASLIELGYEYGRLLAVARVTMTPTEMLDAKSIIDGVELIEKSVKAFKELADNHTRIISAVENARTTSTNIRDALNAATLSLREKLQCELERIKRKQLPPATHDAA